jgi:replicative DNA helicase
MSEEKNPDSPPPVPVRLVKTSPEVNALRRDLLRHALDEGSFARYIVENFRRNDFPGVGDIFDALKRSVQETGGVDRNVIGNAVGWDAFYEFFARTTEIVATGDHWDVAKSEMRKQIRTALHDAVRDQDDARAFALVDRLREPAVAPVEPMPAIPVGEVTEVSIDEFMQTVAQNSKKELLGYRTSLWALDKATSGLIGGETWAIVAPTSGGKTQIAAQIANEVCLQNGRVMYLSLEMPTRRILARLVGANVAMNPKAIFEGKSGMPLNLLRNKVGFFAAQRTVIRDDITELSAIEKTVKDYVASGEPLHLVVIDFIQNISIKGVNAQVERMLMASVRLQALARATGTCILVLSQMSNEAVAAKGKGVLNARYGTELIHAADVMLELVPNDKDNTVECRLRKNRSGAKSSILLRWVGRYSRFEATL